MLLSLKCITNRSSADRPRPRLSGHFARALSEIRGPYNVESMSESRGEKDWPTMTLCKKHVSNLSSHVHCRMWPISHQTLTRVWRVSITPNLLFVQPSVLHTWARRLAVITVTLTFWSVFLNHFYLRSEQQPVHSEPEIGGRRKKKHSSSKSYFKFYNQRIEQRFL